MEFLERKYSSSQGSQSPGFSVDYFLLMDHLTLIESRHLGGKKVLGNVSGRVMAYKNEPDEQVNSGARRLAVLCDHKQETETLQLKYKREHTAQAPYW